jgi:hypothetical protein
MYTAAELALARAMGANPIIGPDTVGNMTTPPLKTLASINSAFPDKSVFYSQSLNEVFVYGSNIPGAKTDLNGYDFGDATITVQPGAKNVTIENSTFSAGAGQLWCIRTYAGGTNTLIKNNTFNGGSASNPLPLGAFIASASPDTITDNKFLNAPGDAIDTSGGGQTIAGNYFSGAGFSSNGTHPDGIWVTDTGADNPNKTVISGNFIDWTWANNATSLSTGEDNDAIRITAEFGPVSNVSVTNNVLLGGVYSIDVGNAVQDPGYSGFSAPFYEPSAGSVTAQNNVDGKADYSGITVAYNYLGFGMFGDAYPGAEYGVKNSNNILVGYTNPTYSTLAWTAYLAKGVSTKSLVIAPPGQKAVGGAANGSSTLYDNGTSDILVGSNNETVFVGGAGGQQLMAGGGVNIFRYLSFSDSNSQVAGGGWDNIIYFNPAKDVIDLSRIDADPATPGLQNFTFIGSAAFTGVGAQIRVFQNAAHTVVQGTMPGSTNPILQITLSGSINLTAANFALTAAQSSLLNGDTTLTNSKGIVTGTEIFLANGVENLFGAPSGGAYSGPVLASATSNSAAGLGPGASPIGSSGTLTLSASSMTVSSGPTALQVISGVNTFNLTAHSSETIQATGAAGETFSYASGFGTSDIVGFQTTNDHLQMQASMFSGLTAGQSAADWAHLLSSNAATQSSGGVTISDAAGDHIVLAGMTLASLTTNAANVFKFV